MRKNKFKNFFFFFPCIKPMSMYLFIQSPVNLFSDVGGGRFYNELSNYN